MSAAGAGLPPRPQRPRPRAARGWGGAPAEMTALLRWVAGFYYYQDDLIAAVVPPPPR